jgi:LPS sulfotransferase NodH
MNTFDPNSHNYDSKTELKSTRNYIICSTPRSGSTLLARGLWDTSIAGKPHEYFHQKWHMKELQVRWNVFDLKKYIDTLKIMRKSENGVFGFKAHYSQLENIIGNIDLENTFPDIKYVYITRNDKIRQGISLYRALLTKSWAYCEPEKAVPVFDYKEISKSIDLIKAEEKNWGNFFIAQKIRPFKIHYENFIINYKITIMDLLKYLDINIPNDLYIGRSPLKKQSDELNDRWVEKYLTKKSKKSIWTKNKIFNKQWLYKLLRKSSKKNKQSFREN